MNGLDNEIETRSRHVASLLAQRERRLVLAESCTAGLLAASLARVPGISAHLCGSMVVYRDATKMRWLNVPEPVLAQHTAVSEQVAELMVRGVLENTPEADVAASITGHLGPDAPADQDGVVFVGLAERRGGAIRLAPVHRLQLMSRERVVRQQEAVVRVLDLFIALLEAGASPFSIPPI
jgi:PncC family amidohydrolase